MLKADDITIVYGKEKVLEHFSCHIHASTLACITGKSGCGKSSLLKAFVGMAPCVEGSIRIDGIEVNEKTCNIVRRKTSYLPQDLSFPSENVYDFIALLFRIGGMENVQFSTCKLQYNMQQLGLDSDLLDKRMEEMSGGQRQRLVLAILALLDKPIWLLDEPTSALDGESRDRVVSFLLDLQRSGKTIVTVSHDVSFASHCTTIISID